MTESRYWVPTESDRERWAGRTVYIIGGGTSLIGMDWSPFRRRTVLGCNDAFLLGMWVDAMIFGDNDWLDHHRESLRWWTNMKVAVTPNDPMDARIRWMNRWPLGFCSGLKGRIAWNENTGFAAINLACILGAARVALLGFDMRLGMDDRGNPKNNWHPNQVNAPSQTNYDRFLKTLPKLIDGKAKTFPDVEILNVVRGDGSALDCWPKITVEEAVAL